VDCESPSFFERFLNIYSPCPLTREEDNRNNITMLLNRRNDYGLAMNESIIIQSA